MLNFNAVIGTEECQWLDFKYQPHMLNNNENASDLLADIAAFANTGWGVILLSVCEDEDYISLTARATAVGGIRPGLFDAERSKVLLSENMSLSSFVAYASSVATQREELSEAPSLPGSVSRPRPPFEGGLVDDPKIRNVIWE